MAGGARHHVERAWLGIECKALPLFALGTAEAELAGRAQGQAEHLVEMRLVAMPADADACVVLRAKDLPDLGRRTAERLDLFDDRTQPLRDRLGLLQAPLGILL